MRIGSGSARLLGLLVALIVGGVLSLLVGPFGLVGGFLAAGLVIGALGNGTYAAASVLMAMLAFVVAVFDQAEKHGWGVTLAIDIPILVGAVGLTYLLAGRWPRRRAAARWRAFAARPGWREVEPDEPLLATLTLVQPYVDGSKSIFFLAQGPLDGGPVTLVGIKEGWATMQTAWVAQVPISWPKIVVNVGGLYARMPSSGVDTLRGIGRAASDDLAAAHRLVGAEFVRLMTRNEVSAVAIEGNQMAVLFEGALKGDRLTEAPSVVTALAGIAAGADLGR